MCCMGSYFDGQFLITVWDVVIILRHLVWKSLASWGRMRSGRLSNCFGGGEGWGLLPLLYSASCFPRSSDHCVETEELSAIICHFCYVL